MKGLSNEEVNKQSGKCLAPLKLMASFSHKLVGEAFPTHSTRFRRGWSLSSSYIKRHMIPVLGDLNIERAVGFRRSQYHKKDEEEEAEELSYLLNFGSKYPVKLKMTRKAQKERIGFLLFLTVIMSATMVGAQSPAPSPAPQDCQTLVVTNLISCLDYVQPNSTAKAPAKDCCTGINGIFNNDPLCLCRLLLNSSSVGLEFNQTRALALPTVCKLDTPPVSVCYTLLPPASAPTGAESPGSGGVAGGPTTGGLAPGSGTGSPTALSPEKSEGDTRLKHSASVILTGLSGAMITIFL